MRSDNGCDDIWVKTVSIRNSRRFQTKDRFFVLVLLNCYHPAIVHYSAHYIHIPYAIKIGKQEKKREDVYRWGKMGEKRVTESWEITTIVKLFSASFRPSTVKMPTAGG